MPVVIKCKTLGQGWPTEAKEWQNGSSRTITPLRTGEGSHSQRACTTFAYCKVLIHQHVYSRMCRSGPPSNNSGVEWYNTGGATEFPAPSGSDYSYNAMPGYNMGGASASFEDEQPLLEGTCFRQQATKQH